MLYILAALEQSSAEVCMLACLPMWALRWQMISTGLGRRPVRKDEEEQLQDVLVDTHDSFKEAVREARGDKIAGVKEAELWSGRVWTGRQATRLGLTDGVARLEDKMREKVGDNVSDSTSGCHGVLLTAQKHSPKFCKRPGLTAIWQAFCAGRCVFTAKAPMHGRFGYRGRNEAFDTISIDGEHTTLRRLTQCNVYRVKASLLPRSPVYAHQRTRPMYPLIGTQPIPTAGALTKHYVCQWMRPHASSRSCECLTVAGHRCGLCCVVSRCVVAWPTHSA